jgi:hypothetical protein
MLSDCVLWKFFGSRKDRKDTQRKTKHMALYAEQLRALEVLWVTQRSQRHAKKNKIHGAVC